MNLIDITPSSTPALLNAVLAGAISKDELIRLVTAKIHSSRGDDRKYWVTFKKTFGSKS